MRRYRRGGVRMYVAGRELQPAASELERKLWRRWPIAMRPRCDLDETSMRWTTPSPTTSSSTTVALNGGGRRERAKVKSQRRYSQDSKNPTRSKAHPDLGTLASQLRSLHSSLPWYFACIGCAGCHMQEFIICCHSSGTSKDRQC